MGSSFKPRKLRRRGISYKRRRRNRPLTVIAMILAACLIVFIGYSIQEPLVKLLSGAYTPHSSSSSSRPSSSTPSTPASSATSSTPSNPPQEVYKGIYLGQNALSDSASLDGIISSAKEAGINLAVIDLKGEDGIVAYRSAVAARKGKGLVAPNAPDAAVAARKLADAGITPAARISCFRDPAAPAAMFSAAVHYAGDHSLRWLDEKGNRWLNPYSDEAQQYIIDLAREAVALGYKQIYLDHVEFPTGTGKAWFGDNLPPRADALRAFVLKARQQVKSAGGTLSVVIPGMAAIGSADPLTGLDQNLYGLGADYFSPNLCPSLLNKRSVTIGGTAIAKPDLDPAGTVAAEAGFLVRQPGAKKSATLPFIQAYTNTALGSGYYKVYTLKDIQDEIAALKNAGINSFILYSPEWRYDLGGLNLQ